MPLFESGKEIYFVMCECVTHFDQTNVRWRIFCTNYKSSRYKFSYRAVKYRRKSKHWSKTFDDSCAHIAMTVIRFNKTDPRFKWKKKNNTSSLSVIFYSLRFARTIRTFTIKEMIVIFHFLAGNCYLFK